MIKRFCDACGTEISRNVVQQRFRPSRYFNNQNFAAEIIVKVGDTWNAGELCLACLTTLVCNPDCEHDENDPAPRRTKRLPDEPISTGVQGFVQRADGSKEVIGDRPGPHEPPVPPGLRQVG